MLNGVTQNVPDRNGRNENRGTQYSPVDFRRAANGEGSVNHMNFEPQGMKVVFWTNYSDIGPIDGQELIKWSQAFSNALSKNCISGRK